ncbi:hypothetical protein D9757_013093 [Collybiopsis confluens]|uniref:Uncharacterized protein n=1 Tax=Collybiopsis confluens TaxID=2823264 RepID=A0A8H5GHG7_9AGAR|nr:hypothetical protein D9757_013093 [Collybiopsis confluens]
MAVSSSLFVHVVVHFVIQNPPTKNQQERVLHASSHVLVSNGPDPTWLLYLCSQRGSQREYSFRTYQLLTLLVHLQIAGPN